MQGIFKPNSKYAMLYEQKWFIPKEPKSIKVTLAHLGWKATNDEEMRALKANNTWELVPKDPKSNIIGSKWVYKIKLKSNGILDRLKA
jgi:hypothetical protein